MEHIPSYVTEEQRRYEQKDQELVYRNLLLVTLVMTIIFEFGFGHYIMGHSWQKLFADYNILQGRVWSLFLLWIMVMPYVFFSILKKKS